MHLSKNIKLLAWFNFSYSFNLYYGIAIIYFVQVTHSFVLGISILSIIQVADALFEIPTGMYSDRIGRKICIIIGSIAQVFAVVFYALGHYYVILAIGAVLEGLAAALYSGNNDALLYETLTATGDEQNYHEHYGKVTSMLSFAAAVSVVLGAIIAYWSFPLALWLSVIRQHSLRNLWGHLWHICRQGWTGHISLNCADIPVAYGLHLLAGLPSRETTQTSLRIR